MLRFTDHGLRIDDCSHKATLAAPDHGDFPGGISSLGTTPAIVAENITRSLEPLEPRSKRRLRVHSVCCIGAGYVGGPTCAVMAAKNPQLQVTVVDLNKARIDAWKTDYLPIHEPGLLDVVKESRDRSSSSRTPNLHFTTDVKGAIADSDLIFVSVNTPTKVRGHGAGRASDLGDLERAVRMIAEVATTDKILVEKSTVPCRTAEMIRQTLSATARPGLHFDVLSNPEFLAEGTAVENLLFPDRVLIGSLKTESGLSAAAELANIYAAWVPPDRIISMNIWSSELAKLAANALLAQRISSINALSAVCEATGADIDDVSFAVGLDTRIGPKMLKASIGFGGGCFAKDVLSLVYMSESLHLPEVAAYWKSVVDINEYQKHRFIRKITTCLNDTLVRKKVALLGFAYKKDTGDTRESAAINIVASLVAEGALVSIYDPQVKEAAVWAELKASKVEWAAAQELVQIASDAYQACEGAHAVVIVTEWDEFSNKLVETNIQRYSTVHPHGLATPLSMSSVEIGVYESLRESTTGGTRTTSSSNSPRSGSFSMDVDPQARREAVASAPRPNKLDWKRVADKMHSPMWVFDGRNVVDADGLREMGFRVESIGRPTSSTL